MIDIIDCSSIRTTNNIRENEEAFTGMACLSALICNTTFPPFVFNIAQTAAIISCNTYSLYLLLFSNSHDMNSLVELAVHHRTFNVSLETLNLKFL